MNLLDTASHPYKITHRRLKEEGKKTHEVNCKHFKPCHMLQEAMPAPALVTTPRRGRESPTLRATINNGKV